GYSINSYGNGHLPAPGYLAYLITGRFSHLETLAFWAQISWMYINPQHPGNPQGLPRVDYGEDRGRAWSFRLGCMVASAWPDADTWVSSNAVDKQVGADYLTWAASNINFNAINATGNALGYWSNMFNPGL